MRFAPDGALWVIQLRGKLLRLNETATGIEAATVLDLGREAKSADPQMGATSVEFGPDFDGKSGSIFIAHNWDDSTCRLGGVTRVLLKSLHVVRRDMIFGPIRSAGAHQVDRLVWDGTHLLVSVGDVWQSALAQDEHDPHGKILSVEAGATNDQQDGDSHYSIVAKGLRNPFALARRSDGLVVTADNGLDVKDGLFALKKGMNCGWGTPRGSGSIDPALFQWKKTVSPDGACFYDVSADAHPAHLWPGEYRGNLFVTLFGPDQHPTTAPLEQVHQILRFVLARHGNSIKVEHAAPFLTWTGKAMESPLDVTVGPDGDLFVMTFDVRMNSNGVGRIYRFRYEP